MDARSSEGKKGEGAVRSMAHHGETQEQEKNSQLFDSVHDRLREWGVNGQIWVLEL